MSLPNSPSRFSIRLCVVILFILTTLPGGLTLSRATAQERPEIDASVLPSSASAAAVVFPKAIAGNPAFRMIPREIISAAGQQQFGFDPMKIRQATFVMPRPNPEQRRLDWGFILQFDELQGFSDDFIEQNDAQRIAGREVYMIPDLNLGMTPNGDSQIVGGTPEYLRQILTESDGDLGRIATAAQLKGDAVFHVNLADLRPLLDQVIPSLPELPGPVEDLKQIPQLLDAISGSFRVDDRLQIEIQMLAKNEEAAGSAQQIISGSMQVFREIALSGLADSMDRSDPVQAATVAYAQRMWDKFEPKFIPEAKGRKLVMNLNEEVLFLAFAGNILVGEFEQIAAEAALASPEFKLRQTALAMHNYMSAHKHFPVHSVVDDDGKPLYSALVEVLPYIEQSNLYNEFRKDEPWNSDHNRKLSETVIPTFMNTDANYRVQFPVFPGSVWDNNGGLELSSITDGFSNTIMAAYVESDRSWADPTPWKISESDLMRDFFGKSDRLIVVMADGSTRTLMRREMTATKLRALLTYAGNDLVD